MAAIDLLEARIEMHRAHVDLPSGIRITYRRNGRVSVRQGEVKHGVWADYLDMNRSVRLPIRPYIELIGQWFGLVEQQWAEL